MNSSRSTHGPLFATLPLLIAAAFSASTQAQTAAATAGQATIYGRLNVNAERVSIGGTAASDAFSGNQRVSANSSRFGLRAKKTFEDITVFGQIETGVSADAGGDTIASRDTFVGLEAGFGKLRIGKMDTPFKELGGLTDRFKGTGIQDEGSVAVLGGSGNGFGRRQNNSVRYDTPALGPLAGQIQYGLETEDSGSATQRKVLSLGATYNAGPLKAAVSLEQHSKFNATNNDTGYRVGVNYNLPMVNIGAGFNRLTYNPAVGSVQRDYFTVTAGVPVGKGVINLRYGKAGTVKGSAPVGTLVVGGDAASLRVGPDSGATQVTVGYEHGLFAGAQVFGYWTKVSNQAQANYRFGVNALNVAAADRGASPSGIAIGIVFDF
jgi:predicted porin